jgi:hypothetical protein
LIEVGFVELSQRPEHADLDRAGIVHGDIQSVEARNHPLDQFLDVARLCHIRMDELRLSMERSHMINGG